MPIRKAGEAFAGVLGRGFNLLPDRVNLFARYVTGVGNRNLELDDSTLSDLRAATAEINRDSAPGEKIKGFGPTGEPIEFEMPGTPKAGPLLPKSGPVGIEVYTTGAAPKSVTNTLGRFNAQADPVANTVRMTDTYDMDNPAVDPDLISGKFLPGKALIEIEAIWNPSAGMRNRRPNFVPADVNFRNEGYNADAVVKSGKYSSTHSPATRMARALLYLSPFAPKPYDIDVTVPYTGRIGNR